MSRRRRRPNLPSRVVATWSLESRNCRTYLLVETRRATENSFVAIRRLAQGPGEEFPTYIKGMTIGLSEVPELIRTLRDAMVAAEGHS